MPKLEGENLYNFYNGMIDMNNIRQFVKDYAKEQKYTLSKNVQIVICSLYHINDFFEISEENREKASKGEFILTDSEENRLYTICSDFIDYDKDKISKYTYLDKFKSFTISMHPNSNRTRGFQVYFKNIDQKQDHRVHVYLSDNYIQNINENYIMNMIEKVMSQNEIIIDSSYYIDIFIPDLALYQKIGFCKFDKFIYNGYKTSNRLHKFEFHDHISDINNNIVSPQQYDIILRNYNSIHLELKIYNAIIPPISVANFDIYFRESV